MNEKDKAPEPTAKSLLLKLDASMRFVLPLPQQNKIRGLINDLLTTVRKEAREAAFKEAVEILCKKLGDGLSTPLTRALVIAALEQAAATDTDKTEKRMRDG